MTKDGFYGLFKELVFQPNAPKYSGFLLNDTENFVRYNLINSISKTQMRNIFELFKSCNTCNELKMLKPKLMYTAARLTGEGKRFLFSLSQKVTEAESDEHCVDIQKFIETVLSYHKYHAKR